MSKKQKTPKGRKIGRNKRPVDQKMSNFVKGRITFEQYVKGR
jgi:hypothetical protein